MTAGAGADGADAPARRRVAVLPDALADQIAAGEVVERPASVIKELCENALDAGATRVAIEIEGGGIVRCTVIDDGVGMDEADLRASVLRHATSKLATLDDLTAIGTFGFRGEALPSIASVSKLRIVTRQRSESGGRAIAIEGGGPGRLEPAGAPPGTRVEVCDLFFNVPARRKFLKALATESAHVSEVVEGVALGSPHVAVSLARDGRIVRDHARAGSREERARDVLGPEELVRCEGIRGPLRIEALLSRPERARTGAGSLRLFVNDRPVKDRALARAVAQAYGSLLDPGRYPVGVVYLDLAPELVDVNVHPQKSEVRFADGRAVHDALYRVLDAALRPAFGGLGQHAEARARALARDRPPESPALATPAAVWSGSGERAAPASTAEPASVPYPVHDATADEAGLRGATFLAQARGMYLLCQSHDAILVIDQHAAAERVAFDRLRRAFASREVAQQRLLVPELVEVGARAVALVEEEHARIGELGMDIRPAGHDRVAVHAVPQILVRHAAPGPLARALLGELDHSGGRAFSGAIDRAIATMACHGSVRAGDAVGAEEARALLAALADVDFGGYCPHGRPVVVRLPFRELDHRVGRR